MSERTLHCDFCGKSQHDVVRLIAGPKVFICNECVGLCDEILANNPDRRRLAIPADFGITVRWEACT